MSGKLKSKGKFQPAVIIVIVVIAAILIATQLYRLSLHNKSGAVGNSALNLYNGGTFCADEDRVYFSNLNDHGALYSMNKELDDFKFMFDDTAGYINNTTAYIVYSSILTNLLGTWGIPDVGNSNANIVTIVSLIFSMMAEELIKFIPLMFLLRVLFKYTSNRRLSIIVSYSSSSSLLTDRSIALFLSK